MFCSNCGAQINDNSRFCENCGYSLENPQNNVIYNASSENNNPYAAVTNPAPVQNNYTQPQSPVYFTPQASQTPVYQPQQNFPNTPPQYLRPVQTPNGVQYMPVEPVVSAKKPAPKYNPFVFVSVGIMGLMIVLCFLPWFTADGSGFNIFDIFTYNIYLEDFDMDAAGVCSFLIIIADGLLIPSLILALVRKNQMPVGFSIAASAITLVTLLFFLALITDSVGDVKATYVLVTMLFLSVANIIFPIIARNKR